MKFIFCILLLVIASINLSAEEHGGGGDGANGSREGKGTKGGESTEGSEGSKGVGDYIKKDEYLELNSSIEQLGAKIKAKKDSLKKLMHEKNEIKDPVAFRDTVKKIESEYVELKEMIESAEKKQAILRFRYPDKGFVKQKKKINVESLEELGVEASIDQELDEAVEVIRNQYGHILKPKEKSVRQPAQTNEKPETKLPAKIEKDQDVQEIDADEDPTGTVILRK
jgi:hypothetical protein